MSLYNTTGGPSESFVKVAADYAKKLPENSQIEEEGEELNEKTPLITRKSHTYANHVTQDRTSDTTTKQ